MAAVDAALARPDLDGARTGADGRLVRWLHGQLGRRPHRPVPGDRDPRLAVGAARLPRHDRRRPRAGSRSSATRTSTHRATRTTRRTRRWWPIRRRCWSSMASSTRACRSARRCACGRTCTRHGVHGEVPVLPRREPLGAQAPERSGSGTRPCSPSSTTTSWAGLGASPAGLGPPARVDPAGYHRRATPHEDHRRAMTEPAAAARPWPTPPPPGSSPPMTSATTRRSSGASTSTSALAYFWVTLRRRADAVRARPVHDHRRVRRRQDRPAAVLRRLGAARRRRRRLRVLPPARRRAARSRRSCGTCPSGTGCG